MGITEHSDALVLIVSEETGIISLARDGKMDRFLDRKTVEKQLLDFYLKGSDFSARMEKMSGIRKWFGGLKKPADMKGKVFGTSSERSTTQEIPAEELQEAVRKFTTETKDLNELKDLQDLMNDPDLEPAAQRPEDPAAGKEGPDA